MAGVSTAVMLVTTALQVAKTVQEGRAQGRAYEAQAGLDEMNADRQGLETSLNEDTLRRQNRQRLAQIAGAQAEAGLVGGTAFGSYMQNLKNTEQDALNLRYQGMSQWQNYKNSAMFNRAYGKNVRSNARTSAFITGLGGAASALTFGGEKGVFGESIAAKFKGA